MAEKVRLLDPESFIRQFGETFKKRLGPKEQSDVLRKVPEFTDPARLAVFINIDGVRKTAAETKQKTILPEQFRQVDWTLVYLKDILFHAYSHLNQTNGIIDADYTFSNIKGIPEPVVITRLRGFGLSGYKKFSREPIGFDGAIEGATQYTSLGISLRSGLYTLSGIYSDEVSLINHVNEKVNLTPEEFREYYLDKIPITDLLSKWGSAGKRLNLNGALTAGIATVMMIALVGAERLSPPEARENINRIMS